jgi:hypothetical protein
MADANNNNEVANLIREMERDYINGNTTIGKYVEYDQYETIEKATAYLNNKHTSGEFDVRNREKPFFDIITACVNIWYRATTIARSKIRIKATEYQQVVLAFVATLLIQDWMRRNDWDAFSDKWDLTEVRYGGAWVEFVEQDGKLIPSVIPWNRAITDTVDFENNPKIKILWLTPQQLRKNKMYDQEVVKALLEARSARETTGGQKKDNKSNYIKVYELHGELERSFLTDKDTDEDEFDQQIQVISFVGKKGKRGEFDDFVLYRGKEKNPHMLTVLIEEDGRALGIGAPEHLFQAQWMTNHSAKQIKDYLDFSSKLFFQTADQNLVGQNTIDAMETGDILVHAANSPLSLVNTLKTDITAIQNFSNQWQVLGKEITSTPDAIAGEVGPSGTPFRSLATANREAHSLFEVMKRNKKRSREKAIREYIIPFVKKQMDTSEEIAALLESQDITTLDQMYVPNEAKRRSNDLVKKQVLSGEIANQPDLNQLESNIRGELTAQGNQRFIKPSDIPTKTWKEVLKDFEWDVEIDIEDKATDDQMIAENLTDFFKILVDPNAQMFLTTPKGKFLFNQILEKTNAVSPLQIASLPDSPPPAMQGQPSVGGSSPAQPVTQGAQPSGSNQGLAA